MKKCTVGKLEAEGRKVQRGRDGSILNCRNVVYAIMCVCGKKYIGRTGRMLENRIAEHKVAFGKREIVKSAIIDHCLKEHASEVESGSLTFGDMQVRVLKRCRTHHETIIAESKFINNFMLEDKVNLLNRHNERAMSRYL
jgi:predicted GIY-YIG superfamily endonuclease